jgi:hypothetical protein
MDQTREMERLTADTSPILSRENTNSPPRHSWPSKEEANQITQ